jgi:hypothetical protein
MTSRTPRGATFAYETATSALGEQLRRIDALDSKAGLLLAAASVLAGLLWSDGPSRPESSVALSIVTILVTLSLLAAVLALSSRKYLIAPRPEVVAELAAADADRIRWHLIGNVLEAVEVNRDRIQFKARLLTFGQVTLLVSILVLGGYSVRTLQAGGA